MQQTETKADQPLRVLIVEDETLIALDLEQEITDMGHEVIGLAEDFAGCREILDRDRPDVALMDIRLRGGDDGVEIARWLRERHDVPAIFISGNVDDDMRDALKGISPLACVTKPVLGPLLDDALSKARAFRDKALSSTFGDMSRPV